jgi:primosomal protein N' (replication factor Y)
LILQVALDTPLRRVFDYLPPAGSDDLERCGDLKPGIRLRVPFGRREMVGILVGVAGQSEIAQAKLKPAVAFLDAQPVFDAVTFELLRWAADYYHHPIGEVFAAALPVGLREGQAVRDDPVYWEPSPAGRRELACVGPRRAPQQQALLRWLAQCGPSTAAEIRRHFKPPLLKALAAREWIVASNRRAAVGDVAMPGIHANPAAGAASEVVPTAAQAQAVAAIEASLAHFAVHLLYGATGSGKTEVYLRAIGTAIAAGGQALVLVPEIALTPQLVQRFRARFGTGVVVLHSALPGALRRDAWRSAHNGDAQIVIGTRSAVFASLPRLALIVVDEEHDASYKQQEGFRYSARDLAVLRAQRAAVPIVLGSATPSLETLENVAQGRYSKLLLPRRPDAPDPPALRLIDLKSHACEHGLSQPALQAIATHLKAGGQIIVFLNRRGYAPTLFCNQCGWVAPCAHCDARMTLHRRAAQLRCHHCGATAPVPAACTHCGHPLNPVGQGTERVEETVARLFPDVPLARLDRDSAAGKGAMDAVLDRVSRGEARILVGTQMLTKGHHFPDVTLVVVLNADQGLFASDFRATERLAQTIIQVAGRAGRETRAGEVLIQTEFPEHPLLLRLITSGYEGFANDALEERREAAWPPYSRLALLRAEARDAGHLDAFLGAAAALGQRTALGQRAVPGRHETAPGQHEAGPPVAILGPAIALLARRADHFRAHLLIQASGRPVLQRFLERWLRQVDQLAAPAGLRWSIDVDPLEVD